MRYAFAIEIKIGFFDDANLVELCGHDVWVLEFFASPASGRGLGKGIAKFFSGDESGSIL